MMTIHKFTFKFDFKVTPVDKKSFKYIKFNFFHLHEAKYAGM